ncbi:hypothetical protein [Couchioplanes azureus]|uniref:hypothetical protein n=1 Tax=Couchioplanes caeruleus TaxID=56438 RepID=UPI00166F8230|nr:hypothetical protein [Couchioplanes caeruleus]GGQ60190.1 hypothetical protein GCM10010166_32250 [Couchioplanes caeruleus subsp. azureus]
MIQDRAISRRQVLRVGAVAGSAVTLVAASAQAAPADPGGGATQARSRGDLARVAAVRGRGAVVGAPRAANRTALASREEVPFAGFPDGVTPRPGDLVTVIDTWPGLELAAVPVVHWLTGVPHRAAGGGYHLAGERIAASPLLDAHRGQRLRVCVMDTELPDAQVFAVRPA